MARAASVPRLWTPGFLLLCGACVWVWVSQLPRQFWLGSWVCVFGYGFLRCPAIPGWGLWCVCLGLGFAVTLSFLAGVYGVGVWVWVLAGPRNIWLGLWCVCFGLGFSCTTLFLVVVVCPLARAPPVAHHPRVRLPVARGCVGVAVGGFPPPSSIFCGLPVPGGVSVCSSRPCRVLARWWLPSPVSFSAPLVSALPAPFVWVSLFFFPCPSGRRPATSQVKVCAGVSGVSFFRLFGRCVVGVGRGFWWGAFGLVGVVTRFPIGGPHGCRLWWCPAGSRPPLWNGCAASRLCVGPPRFHSSPLAGGCVLLEGWGFPPFVFFFFGEGPGSPFPPSAFPRLVHALVGKRCG